MDSTSSKEDMSDETREMLNELANDMFKKTQDYIFGEFTSIEESYNKLDEMNRLTISKYTDIHRISGNLAMNIANLNESYNLMRPFFEKIDLLEESVGKLEKMAYALEAYSKRLQTRYNRLPK